MVAYFAGGCLSHIHDLGNEVCKVFDVSGCQRRTADDYNTRDLSVAHVDGSAILLPFGCEACCGFGCRAVEIQYPLLQILSQ
jgi:hypothetical protein